MKTLYDKKGVAVTCRDDQIDIMIEAGYKDEAPKVRSKASGEGETTESESKEPNAKESSE